ERITRLRLDDVVQHHAVRRLVDDVPRRLADEPVDRVPVLRLRERQLQPLAVELVAPVLDPVRPRGQHLTAAGGRPRRGSETVDELPAGDLVRAEPATEGDDADALLSARDLDLSAAFGAGHAELAHTPTSAGTAAAAPSRSSRWSPTRSEFAIAVKAGLTAPMLGKTLVSTTYRLSSSCARQSAFTTEVAGSSPIRHVPAWWAQPATGISFFM